MPRDIPIGNGQLLICFDQEYQLRDLYFPHVGEENHLAGNVCRFGAFVDGRLAWTHQGWQKQLKYLHETLVTSVTLTHPELRLQLVCNDAVDFHRPILVRRIVVRNQENRPRRVKLYCHHDIQVFGSKLGDTAYFDPRDRTMVHYRGPRWFAFFYWADGKPRIDEYATGTSGFRGAEGTWRDAEDGHLQGNPIAQGAVDSTIGVGLDVPGNSEREIYYVGLVGKSREDIQTQLKFLLERAPPEQVLERTASYWNLWVNGASINFGNLPGKVVDMFKRSLLVLRTQVDNDGAVIAANDSDIQQYSRDTYSYCWQRDGALVAHALDKAGFSDLARNFYSFCNRTITEGGYFLHKYNPDGTPASSWHPLVDVDGAYRLPIQEDETGLVLWALWRHYYRYRDLEFVRPLYLSMILPAGNFLAEHRGPHGLPRPSYDLWEERYGIHAFTVAATYAGLKAARNFALSFGDQKKADEYEKAYLGILESFCRNMYSKDLGRFVRKVWPMPDGSFDIDPIVDASLFGITQFHMLPADDPRIEATYRIVEERLWVKTKVGGLARYENDPYQRVSNDVKNVPGNPWFICTLWLADHYIQRARNLAQLKEALPIFEWVANHALSSGVLAEQVNPYTSEPISVSPLTWSHGTIVLSVMRYLEKLEELQSCPSCGQSIFRMVRTGRTQIKSQTWIEKHEVRTDAGPPPKPGELALTGSVVRDGRTAALAIDDKKCSGCGVCVSTCVPKIFEMVQGKSFLNLGRLADCTVCLDCEKRCPTGAIAITQKAAVAAVK